MPLGDVVHTVVVVAGGGFAVVVVTRSVVGVGTVVGGVVTGTVVAGVVVTGVVVPGAATVVVDPAEVAVGPEVGPVEDPGEPDRVAWALDEPAELEATVVAVPFAADPVPAPEPAPEPAPATVVGVDDPSEVVVGVAAEEVAIRAALAT